MPWQQFLPTLSDSFPLATAFPVVMGVRPSCNALIALSPCFFFPQLSSGVWNAGSSPRTFFANSVSPSHFISQKLLPNPVDQFSSSPRYKEDISFCYTVIVGILFLISLLQALGFRLTGSFFVGLVTRAILPFTLTSILVLEDKVEYAK